MNKKQNITINSNTGDEAEGKVEEKEDIEGVIYSVRGARKKVKQVKVTSMEEYLRGIRNLQLIAISTVFIITTISPLRLLESRTAFDLTAIGFIIAGIVPSLYAIFVNAKGRRVFFYMSIFIYGTWILILSTHFWEIILLISILIIYFETTNTLLFITPILNNIETISEGGAYYHAGVFLKRYIKYLFKFSGLVIGFSIILGVIGWYAFEYLPSDILFSLFMIISLILIIFISRKTLTLDAQKEILEDERRKAEKELIKSHSRYA